ncbi:vacuolar protein sorting-associated protein VTA1 homolog isoform X2 [Frieseomelitta varia]|uniref:vacuolar protein sorting-associated protein VTA1 homolog isoform X2 n=1 Tax=Frieseomelitta varia TaxID=561572 RepID=UPI001CB6B5E8|nr:vacuolar protein sorting-associated protein VTA1 homolog isoform X2 [Frieseomelitta varia]
MIDPDLPEIPLPLKSIQHYLKIASNHDQRDPVVSYWCRLYALQTGLKLSTKTPKETNFLMKLMDWLETTKKELHDNEAITNDIAAQAHLENWALKLFLFADKNDRAGNFGKNVVQSFFTAGLLYDVLTVFGELNEEATQNRKYAKWKAAYIHNCIKNNETPIPGPMQEGNENADLNKNMEEEAKREDALNTDELDVTSNPSGTIHGTTVKKNMDEWSSDNKDSNTIPKTESGAELSVEEIGKAQKFIKWAGSALNYDDVPTAILNLQKALHLLTTGQEPA